MAKKKESNWLKCSFAIDLNDPHAKPITAFEGHWSPRMLDRAFKQMRRGLIMYRREKLRKEKPKDGAERSEYKPTAGERGAEYAEPNVKRRERAK